MSGGSDSAIIKYVKDVADSLGQVCAVIGAQWGDEGKGKLIDLLAGEFDVVARACGGANAGHTVIVNGKKHVFHLLPSGALHPNVQVVLGAGMVIDVSTLLEEIEVLKKAGVDILPRLHISAAAHIVTQEHKERDAKIEEERSNKIGTTKRGIGPAYGDKALRVGMRMESNLQSPISNCLVSNIAEFMNDLIKNKKRILIEGAQGVLLDIDHGTYPYVTSSSTTVMGALQGLGLPPKVLHSCIGVAKAYCTRVGEGPFAAEIQGDTANRIRERGGEYGATTGRPRRVGWLSIPDLQYAALLNGFTCWNITKLDVLDEEKMISVEVERGRLGEFPGWQTSTSGITSFEKLPQQAQSYIQFIEEKTGIPALWIGTGPDRRDMIVKSI
ncbi:adenylosuccinate synthetase [Candidatus Peregrinibacteria bacterium]|nr:adenylosuccinate synthetase [Candidatus Peregrinibacteria bacterium]